MKKVGDQKTYIDVMGLCCTSEVPMIENILKSFHGIKEFSVIVPTRTIIVVHDKSLVSQLEIVKALNRARLEANLRVGGVQGSYRNKWPNPYAVICGVLVALSFLMYVYRPLRWLALGGVAIGIYPIIMRSVASVRQLRLDINILMIIAVVGTIAIGDYTEAGAIVFLFTMGEWLESRASHKTNAAMQSLMSIAPQKAVIAETGEEVDVDEVKLNVIVVVKAGEVIPMDGIIVDGGCDVDERNLTGEPFPVSKQTDSVVWAGTINMNGYITVKTTSLAEDSVMSKMAKLVEKAQNSKTKTQRFIDRCVKFYTPAVIVTSACIAVIPVALRVHNLKYWFHMALVVLVSACPCALVLSTPVATYCALTKAAASGLLFKGGEYLETLAKIKVIAFDKTGTITSGEFVVTDFRSLCDISIDTLLNWVSCIESKSSHPMAVALVEYGKLLSIEPKPEDVDAFQNFPGEGVYGKIDGKDIYIGNSKIALRAGCGTVEGDSEGGKGVRYIFSGTTRAGTFTLSDSCRTGVSEAIKELKLLGIKTAMLTGDSHAEATHVQQQLGNVLELVHAELLPEDKARLIEEFKKVGPTAMIGDGVNDAPGLAVADIGISMGISGSALATETGDLILMSNDIRKVPKAIKLARKTHRTVIENVIFSFSTKAAILGLAFAGHPLIWAAVLADVGTCLLVIFNSMLLLREPHRHSKNGPKCGNSSLKHKPHKHSCNSDGHHHHSHKVKCCDDDNPKDVLIDVKEDCVQKRCCSSEVNGSMCSENGNETSVSTSFHEHSCNSDGHRHHSHKAKCCDDDNPKQVLIDVTEDCVQKHCCSSEANGSMCSENGNEASVSTSFHDGCCNDDNSKQVRIDGREDCVQKRCCSNSEAKGSVCSENGKEAHVSTSSHDGHCHTGQRKLDQDLVREPADVAIDISIDVKNKQSMALNGGKSLENREETGSCCKNHMQKSRH